MGTDIHGWLQKSYGGKNWYNVQRVPSDRNYTLFAALANVRNGRGFAGCYTGEAIRFIAEPRGLPADLAAQLAATELQSDNAADDDGINYYATDFGDHSQTWFTLAELLNWDGWQQQQTRGGYVARSEYEACQREGRTPDEWCGDTFGRDIVKTTDEAIAAGSAPEGWTHAQMRWDAGKLIDNIGAFREWMAYLSAAYKWELGREDSYCQYRIVVGFDS